MFEGWKARRAETTRLRDERRAAALEQERLAELAARRTEIEEELAFAQQRLDAATGAPGVTGAAVPAEVGVVLKKGESVYCVVTDAVLIEPRKGPGQWKGRSQGVSVPIPGRPIARRSTSGSTSPSRVPTTPPTGSSRRAATAPPVTGPPTSAPPT